MNWRAIVFLTLLAAGMPARAPAQQSAGQTGQPPAQQPEPQPRLSVAYPGNAWSLVVDSPGFIVKMEGKKADGREYLLANHPDSSIVLTAILEQSTELADSRTCPSFLQSRVKSMSKLNIQDIKYAESGFLVYVEFLVLDVQGIPVNQKNFYACSTKDNTFIDIHLSKAKFQPDDESIFIDILNHIHITASTAAEIASPKASSTPASGVTSSDYFRDASRAYAAHDYQSAVAPFQRAFELEKLQPTLSKNDWLLLIDHLGMALVLTGKSDSGEQTFFYGYDKDPDYPLFSYHLACIYAGKSDMGRSAGFLQKAFSAKAHAIPGETLPDPRKDACFQPFMSDDRFVKFLQSLPISD